MGIYSMFENIGQTLGPVIYGAVLMLGNRKGIFLLFLSRSVQFFYSTALPSDTQKYGDLHYHSSTAPPLYSMVKIYFVFPVTL